MDKRFNPIFLSESRLAIVGLLYNTYEVEFTKIKEELKLTSGNLSVQIQKLYAAKFVEIDKKFKGNYPQTICRITPIGIIAFEDFIASLNSFLEK